MSSLNEIKKRIKNGWDNYLGNTYFDKQATIDKYYSLVKEEDRPDVSSFDELYEIACEYVGKQQFDKYTEGMADYFHSLSKKDFVIAIGLGVVSFGLACVLDAEGNNIEKAINKHLPNKNYDVNNAFDLKIGRGHRIFGHDIPAFGIKNIPADYIIQVKDGLGEKQYAKLGEFLGINNTEYFSMWDIIWNFYGDDNVKFKGIMNCLGHIIAHFGKDLFTKDGLPLPFISLFNEFMESETFSGKVLNYKNSFLQKLDMLRLNMKANDFATFILIEAFTEFYCNKMDNGDDISGFKHDMKLLSMGTCISLQMADLLIGEGIQADRKAKRKLVPGGKINVLMCGGFFKIAVQEMVSVISARNEINSFYDEKLEGLE